MSGIELLTCYIPITMCYNSYDEIYVLKKKKNHNFLMNHEKIAVCTDTVLQGLFWLENYA